MTRSCGSGLQPSDAKTSSKAFIKTVLFADQVSDQAVITGERTQLKSSHPHGVSWRERILLDLQRERDSFLGIKEIWRLRQPVAPYIFPAEVDGELIQRCVTNDLKRYKGKR